MNSIKKFKVSHGDENAVSLEVDTNILTIELATQINEFWSDARSRLNEQNGDVVQAVARMFGVAAIRAMETDGGVTFSEGDADSSKRWTKVALEYEVEGWPAAENLGIRITMANVYVAEYFSVNMEEESV